MAIITSKKTYCLAVLAMLTLCSCETLPYQGESSQVGKQMCMDVISYLDEGDSNKIYNCFSNNAKTQVTDLKEQIQSLIVYYQGNFESFNLDTGNYSEGSGSYREFKTIKDISTQYTFYTTQDAYSLTLKWRTNDDLDSDNIGLNSLYIEKFIDEENRTKFPEIGLGITINHRE